MSHEQHKLVMDQLAPRMPLDNEGKSAMATTSGELQVAYRSDDVSISFEYGPNPYDTSTVVTGTGHAGRDGSMAYISPGAGIGSALVESRDAVWYRSGHEMICAISHQFAPPEPDLIQRVGFLNGDDAWCVGYDGDSEFGIWFIRGGVEEFIPASAFHVSALDGSASSTGFRLNPQTNNIYKLSYGWHGNLPPMLSVYGGYQRGWVFAHVEQTTNTLTDVHLQNPNLPVAAYIARTAGSGADVRAKFGSWRAGSVSGVGDEPSVRRFNYEGLGVVVAGVDLATTQRRVVLTLRSKSAFGGKQNHIRVEAQFGEFVADGTKSVVFEMWRSDQGTFDVPAAAWVDRDTNSSVMEYDNTTARVFTAAAGQFPAAAMVLGKADSRDRDTRGQGLFLYPGREYVITARSANATEVSYSLILAERF